MERWIVEYIKKDENKQKEMFFNTREEAEKFIEEISDNCSHVNLRYDWGI